MMPARSLRDPGSGAQSLAGLRVLLVEDTWHVAQATKSMLENALVEVIGPTATSVEAQKLLAPHLPDAAVVDLNLHGRLAFDLIDCLSGQNVPVIVITGYENLPELEDKTEVVLSKPVRAKVLLDVLRQIAGRRQCS